MGYHTNSPDPPIPDVPSFRLPPSPEEILARILSRVGTEGGRFTMTVTVEVTPPPKSTTNDGEE